MSDPQTPAAPLTRKHFLLLTAATLAGVGCAEFASAAAPKTPTVVDAGPAAHYAADGIYSGFRTQGFFLIRGGGKLVALSIFCPHRHCKVNAQPDLTFECPCHGSTFDATGKVTEGPSRKDLPSLPFTISPDGHVLVTVA